jgi:transposase
MLLKSHKNIIFTDESMIDIRRNTAKLYHFKGQKRYKLYSNKLSIMVFGGISLRGKVIFKILDVNVNSESYIEVLKDLIVKADLVYPAKNWKLMQDNAPAHKSELVTNFISQKGVKLVHHPPQSPDLNPIEAVWSILKKRIEKLYPKNKDELRKCAIEAWESIPNKIIRNFICNLKKRMLVVKRSGGHNIPLTPRLKLKMNYFEENQTNMSEDENY